jgi:hypothetical protein
MSASTTVESIRRRAANPRSPDAALARAASDRRMPTAPLRRTRAYAERRTAKGKTQTEIIRCLKRYIARELYHAPIADLLPPPIRARHPGPIISIACGAGTIGRNVTAT